MKTVKRTTIIVETREVLLVASAPFRGRCARCGGQVEFVGAEIVETEIVEAEIIGAEKVSSENRQPQQDASRASNLIPVESGDELRFIRPPSSLK